jgi:AAA+ ATPase superfamily predicted ATPase
MPAPTKTFLFDSLLSESDICNQKRERDAILSGVRSGLKLLIYGRRNYGKTSLVKNVVAKKWLEENPNGFYCYVDLMGVRSLTNISERMTVAFSEAYNCAFRLNALFQSLLGSLKQLKPTLELDDSGTPKLSLAMSPQNQPTHFVQILRHIGTLAEKVKICTKCVG